MKQIFTISNQLIALGKRLAMVLTMLLTFGIGQAWGAVTSGNTYNTTSSMPEGWSKDGDYNNSSYLKLVASTNYIQTDAFCVKSFSSIKIKARKYGGPSENQAKITVEWIVGKDTISLGTITPSSTTLTDYTISSPTSVSADQDGYIKISCKGASSSKGSGVSQVTITYTSGNCSSTGTGGDGDSGDNPGDNSGKCTWELVTDASTLKAGDRVVIAAKDYNYAMSTDQKSNNRGQTSITKNNSNITFGNDVQILTLSDGKSAGTLAFNTGSGYLYAASSSDNYLRTENTLSDNSSWSITIANDGTATLKAQGNYSRNTMQYNQSSSLFACYSSASQKALVIYKEVCTKETTVTLNPNGGSGTMDNVTTENGTLTLSECTFTRDGYTFAGWAISEEGEAIYEDKDVIDNWDANNTTLYAQWTPIEYQITYEGLEGATNGDNPNTYTIESETITFEEPGERVGYTFKGWEPEIIEAGSTGNVTIIATWEKIVLSNNCKWVEVTDNTTLEDGDEVVITMTWGATTWALPNNGGTSTPEVVVVNNVDGDKMLSVSNDMIWTVDEGDGNYSFYPMGSNATWLYCTNNNDGVRVGTGENKYFTIVNGLASDSENYFLYHVATSRYVGVYHPNEGIPDWRCYKLTDKGAFPTNIKNQSLKFYKKTCLMSNEFWIDYELANVTCTNTPPIRRLLKTAKPSC